MPKGVPDPRTVFVSGIGSDFSERDLEEAFGEVGPIRRSFLVGARGKAGHIGSGFVQFALAEDAAKAVTEYNGKLLQGSLVQVKPATKRAPLAERKQLKRAGNAQEESGPAHKKPRQSRFSVISAPLDPMCTVALGNLSPDAFGAAREEALKCGSVIKIITDIPEQDISNAKLREDGCQGLIIFVVYKTIKEAVGAVQRLHGCKLLGSQSVDTIQGHQPVPDMTLWARQLKGEGAMVKKWRLIMRNLPFNVTAADIESLLSPAGFVWQVTLPSNIAGASKGFAFASFTSRVHAERAILSVNGKSFKGRIVVVDWAVPKATFQASSLAESKETSDAGNEAFEEAQASEEAASSGDANEQIPLPIQEADEHHIRPSKEAPELPMQMPITTERETNGNFPDESEAEERPKAGPRASLKQPGAKSSLLGCTVFVRGLLNDTSKQELQARLEAFGKVRACRLVMSPLTGKCKGTAFVEFVDAAAAGKAAEASDLGRSGQGPGVLLSGRPLDVKAAVAQDDARLMAANQPERPHDKRNLYLAREGQIEENSPAWDDMSKSDREKRKRADSEKTMKLRSPNFFVSNVRLCLRNLPYSIEESALRKLLIAAVKSRAVNAKPKLTQVKVLHEAEARGSQATPRSKGIAFAQFDRHEHALCALRQLNNNPGPFGHQRRPIIEFAVENSQTIKKRELRETHKKRRAISNAPTDAHETQTHQKPQTGQLEAKQNKSKGKAKGTSPKIIGRDKAVPSDFSSHAAQADSNYAASPSAKALKTAQPKASKSKAAKPAKKRSQTEQPDKLDELVVKYKASLFGQSTPQQSKSKGELMRRWFE